MTIDRLALTIEFKVALHPPCRKFIFWQFWSGIRARNRGRRNPEKYPDNGGIFYENFMLCTDMDIYIYLSSIACGGLFRVVGLLFLKLVLGDFLLLEALEDFIGILTFDAFLAASRQRSALVAGTVGEVVVLPVEAVTDLFTRISRLL